MSTENYILSKSLEELRENRVFVKDSEDGRMLYGIEEDDVIGGFWVYEGGGYILKDASGKFHVVVGRSEYESHNLSELEEVFWDEFIKDENGLSDEEIEEELHLRARELMMRIDAMHGRESELSLDEYLAEYDCSEEEKYSINYLLKQF